MGFRSYRPTTETVAASATASFSDAVLPPGGIQDFTVVTTGANNHLGTTTTGIDSVRVKVNGVTTVDLTAAMVRALIEALAPANLIPVADQLRFTIPLSLPRFQVPSLPGAIGIPLGARTSVEIVTNSNGSAGTASLGWRGLSVQPRFMMRAIQSATNVAASTNNNRVELKTGNDLVVGFLMPLVHASTGITRLRIVQMLNGVETQLYHASIGHILEGEQLENPGTLTTTAFFVRLPDGPYVMPPGSYLEIDTGASSAAGNAYAPVTLVDLMAK